MWDRMGDRVGKKCIPYSILFVMEKILLVVLGERKYNRGSYADKEFGKQSCLKYSVDIE